MIDEADDIRLNEIYDWLHDGTPDSIQYSPAEIETFYNRLSGHQEGKSKSFTVEGSFNLIRNKKV